MQVDIQKTAIYNKKRDFALNHLKGEIGQAVIETYLLDVGYDIYPYGYENYYANITQGVLKDYLDTTTTQLRTMPDLLVDDKYNNERFLLQIKATTCKNESNYWIEKNDLDSYKKYWSEALLIVYCIPTGHIYCNKIADIPNSTQGSSPGKNKPCYYLNLIDFHKMKDYLRLFKSDTGIELSKEIDGILKLCSQESA
jgi:hypothetical protein